MESKRQHRICVPICEASIDGLERAIAKAAEVSDLVEARLDCLDKDELEAGSARIENLLRKSRAIVTFRPAEQGGGRELDFESRSRLWSNLAKNRGANLFDLELDLVRQFASSKDSSTPSIDWSRVICSFHDFAGVPADLDQIYEQMASTSARILKIALHANDITDCLPIFGLLDRAGLERREMIAIAMGTAGIATRILGPSRGAFLTYGALDHESVTAPGQITAKELRTLYRVDKIDAQTKIMGLVGLPVHHSLSYQIHNAAFESSSVNAVYIPFEVRDIASFFRLMVHPLTREIEWNMRGLSVTAPYKSMVMSFLDWVEPAAKEIGAVNTIVTEDRKLCGYNTDASALIAVLVEKAGSLRGARIAVIGAGGAACAAIYGLQQQGAVVTIFARDDDKARSLAERFGASHENLRKASFTGFDVVINATPLGTQGPLEDETPATSAQLSDARWAYDLVYNPLQTRFLQEAENAGCQVIVGLSMLLRQASRQFKLWTGRDAPEDVMREAAMSALAATQ